MTRDEMEHTRICARRTDVPGRMRTRRSLRRRPPPPPALTAPTASLSANPNTIDQGQSTTLTWQTTNATDVSIDGIGPVDPSGSRQVTPADSTTYHLIAKGAGGTQDATARVTVNPAQRDRRRQQLLMRPKKNSSRET